MLELRPSSAHCWMACTGQPVFVQSLNLPDTSSVHADEGSAAHELGAEALDNEWESVKHKLGDYITINKNEFQIDFEMIAAVDHYVSAINRASYGKRLLVERKVDCGKVLGRNRSGTADSIIIPHKGDKHSPLEFHDYKHGRGVEVFAERNYQLLIYASGFYTSNEDNLKHIKKVKLVIHQPRIKSAPDEWEVTVEQLLKFAEKVRGKVVQAEKSKVGENLKPGDKQCQFCDAKAHCPALRKEVMAVFDNIDEYSATVQLPADVKRLAHDYKKVPLIEMWTKAMKETCHRLLEQGQEFPGQKLVEGRKGHRKWKSEKDAKKALLPFRLRRDEMFDNKLRSPAQIQKTLTDGRFQKLVRKGLIVQEPGKPTVVPENDPRVAIAAASVFDDLT